MADATWTFLLQTLLGQSVDGQLNQALQHEGYTNAHDIIAMTPDDIHGLQVLVSTAVDEETGEREDVFMPLSKGLTALLLSLKGYVWHLFLQGQRVDLLSLSSSDFDKFRISPYYNPDYLFPSTVTTHSSPDVSSPDHAKHNKTKVRHSFKPHSTGVSVPKVPISVDYAAASAAISVDLEEDIIPADISEDPPDKYFIALPFDESVGDGEVVSSIQSISTPCFLLEDSFSHQVWYQLHGLQEQEPHLLQNDWCCDLLRPFFLHPESDVIKWGVAMCEFNSSYFIRMRRFPDTGTSWTADEAAYYKPGYLHIVL